LCGAFAEPVASHCSVHVATFSPRYQGDGATIAESEWGPTQSVLQIGELLALLARVALIVALLLQFKSCGN